MACVAHKVEEVRTHCECGKIADGYADRTHGWCKSCLGTGNCTATSHTAYLRTENLFVFRRPMKRE